jgi:thiamine-monophosphate kinase
MARSTQSSEPIGGVGEFRFLSELLPRLRSGRGVVVGPGQDCAVLRAGPSKLLATVDAVVEGVHFKSEWMSPHQLGRRSFLVNASDIAAMGGRPRWCLVSIAVPRDYSKRALVAIHKGLDDAAAEAGACIVGGNVTASSRLCISVTLIAEAPKRIVTRRGARPGDRVFVTGTVGDAALGVRCLRDGSGSAHAVRRYREPTPRLKAGRLLIEAGVVSAMIDVSDGLVQDLDHVCTESGVGAVVEASRLPLSPAFERRCRGKIDLALSGGEDYELLCTASVRKDEVLGRLRSRLGCEITAIGRITKGRGVRVVDGDGARMDLDAVGHDHFS